MLFSQPKRLSPPGGGGGTGWVWVGVGFGLGLGLGWVWVGFGFGFGGGSRALWLQTDAWELQKGPDLVDIF